MSIKILAFVLIAVTLAGQGYASDQTMMIGDLIERVIDGEDFTGKEIDVRGVVLDQTDSGLVSLGTRATYQSAGYLNFISVYETSMTLRKGSDVTLRIMVEMSRGSKVGDQSVVMFDSAFVKCLSCE